MQRSSKNSKHSHVKIQKRNQFLKIFNSAFFLIIPSLFFLVSLMTLYDYGMNWDSPVHFARGQAYLRYILTRKEDYEGLPNFCMSKESYVAHVDFRSGVICDRHNKNKVSEYESRFLDYRWAKENDIYGHPPFSDIMMAITNQVFYKSLGWIEDIQAYHVFGVFMTFLMAVTIAFWVRGLYGIFASCIAGLSLYLFPLLWAEQHFNVKDPAMAAFFLLGIYFFWKAVVRNNWKYMLLSALFAGASFSTKINYVFALLILFPWLALFVFFSRRQTKFKKSIHGVTRFVMQSFRRLSLANWSILLIYPLIIFLIFFLCWPVLWSDPVKNIKITLGFYQGIGEVSCPYPRFTLDWFTSCSSMITINRLFFTTPIVTLIFLGIGVFYAVVQFREKYFTPVLWLLVFLVPIVRVTIPLSSVYGGVRQIMEFIPGMAVLAALGALTFRNVLVTIIIKTIPRLKNSKNTLAIVISIICVSSYIPFVLVLVKMHPNENIYFNGFIGGLRGAAKVNFPGYDNTYGNAYLAGVKWLNENAEKDARLALVAGLGQNISRASLRSDISFLNYYFSSYMQQGEYLVLLEIQAQPAYSLFTYRYANRFLEPVYKLEVDGVRLLTIWKNDNKHVKKGVDMKSEVEQIPTVTIKSDAMYLEIDEVRDLKRIEFNNLGKACEQQFKLSKMETSIDGINFVGIPENINDYTIFEVTGYNVERVFLFAQNKGSVIRITPPQNSGCNLSEIAIAVFTFPETK